MKQLTQTGHSVEEAIEEALKKLDVTRDEVEINVLSEGKKGFLGFGSKLAEVQVTVLAEREQPTFAGEDEQSVLVSNKIEEATPVKVVPQTQEEAMIEAFEEETTKTEDSDAIGHTKRYLESIAKELGIDDLQIEEDVDGKFVKLQLSSSKAALLIGKRGQTLNALQQLAQLVLNQHSNNFSILQLDVEDYRARRQESLETLADRLADKAIRTGKKVELEPMPSYERKIIHHALSTRLDIETHSEGNEPNRYLVIEPLK